MVVVGNAEVGDFVVTSELRGVYSQVDSSLVIVGQFLLDQKTRAKYVASF